MLIRWSYKQRHSELLSVLLKWVAYMVLHREKRARLLSEVHSDRTGGNGHKLEIPTRKFQLDLRKYLFIYFTYGCVQLLEQAVGSASLEVSRQVRA